MAEKWTLTTPVYPGPSISDYSVTFINLNWEKALVHIGWKDNLENRYEHSYKGDTATNLMIALNKANLTLKSLHRRILERLNTDGVLGVGNPTGTPD